MKNASEVRQAASGDEALGFTPPLNEGFVREVVRHQDRLREFIRCLLFNPQDVDDVWRETNVVLLKKAGDFRLVAISGPGRARWPAIRCSRTAGG